MSYKIGWCFLCWVSENNPNQMQKNSSQCHCEWEHWYMVVIWQFLVSIINNSVVSKLTRWVWKGGSLGWGWHPPKTLSLVCVFGIDLQLWWKHISAVLLGWKCHTVCFCEGGTIKVLLLCPIWWTLKTTVPVMPVQKDYVKCIIAQSSAEQSSITWISSFFFFLQVSILHHIIFGCYAALGIICNVQFLMDVAHSSELVLNDVLFVKISLE